MNIGIDEMKVVWFVNGFNCLWILSLMPIWMHGPAREVVPQSQTTWMWLVHTIAAVAMVHSFMRACQSYWCRLCWSMAFSGFYLSLQSIASFVICARVCSSDETKCYLHTLDAKSPCEVNERPSDVQRRAPAMLHFEGRDSRRKLVPARRRRRPVTWSVRYFATDRTVAIIYGILKVLEPGGFDGNYSADKGLMHHAWAGWVRRIPGPGYHLDQGF